MSVLVLELDGVGKKDVATSNVAVQVYALILGQSDLLHLKATGPRTYREL